MIRKLTLSLATMATMFAASAATYEVSFENTNLASTPDSVLVENLTRSESVMVQNGQLLNLIEPNAAGDLAAEQSQLSVFPNPVTDVATVEYYNTAAGEVSVMVTAVSGATVATLAQDLPAGKLSFSLSGLAAGSYVVTVCTASSECESTLVVSENANSASPALAYVSAETEVVFPVLKKALVLAPASLDHNDGDNLRFTAYMGAGNIAKEQTVSTNITISFPFVGYTSFSAPDSVKFDSAITITGVNFGTDKGALTVAVNGKEQTISTLTDTEITFAVAKKTFSGNIAITKDGYSAEGGMVTYHNTYTVGSKLVNEGVYRLTIDPVNGNIIYIRESAGLELVVANSEGQVLDTILSDAIDGIYPYGLIWSENNDTMYMGDYYGRILYMLQDSYTVDTLIGLADNYTNLNADGVLGFEKGEDGVYYIINESGDLVELMYGNPSYSNKMVTGTGGNADYYLEYKNDYIYYGAGGGALKRINVSTGDYSDVISIGTSATVSVDYIDGIGFLVAFGNNDLYIYDAEKNTSKVLLSDINSNLGIIVVYSIAKTKEGDLLIGGDKGIIKVIVE